MIKFEIISVRETGRQKKKKTWNDEKKSKHKRDLKKESEELQVH